MTEKAIIGNYLDYVTTAKNLLYVKMCIDTYESGHLM